MPLAKVWVYCKKFWFVFAGVLGFVLFSAWRSDRSSLSKTLEEIKKAHDDELREIQEAQAQRDRDRIESERRLQEHLALIEKQYVQAQKELDDKKKQELRRIIEETKDDPAELARRLADATGFAVVLPEE